MTPRTSIPPAPIDMQHPTASTPAMPAAATRVAAADPARARRAAATRRTSWLVSFLLHGALVFGAAAWVVSEPESEVARDDRSESVTRLDLRTTSFLDARTRPETFDVRADPRAGVPEPLADERPIAAPIPSAPLDELIADTVVAPGRASTEVEAPAPADLPSPSDELARSAARLAHATRLPARTLGATSGADHAPGAGSPDGSGASSTGGGGGASTSGGGGPVGVPGANGSEATSAQRPDEPPELVEGSDPSYPPISRRRGEEGRVECKIRIDATGAVTSVEVETSSGFPRLDEAACRALEAWKFRPGKFRGQPVACVILHGVTFRLVRS